MPVEAKVKATKARAEARTEAKAEAMKMKLTLNLNLWLEVAREASLILVHYEWRVLCRVEYFR
jgi:hypothetical protein